MEDRRAHQRLDVAEAQIGNVTTTIEKHLSEHSKFEKALADNVKMTTEIAKNTAELVELFKVLLAIAKGANWIRSFIIWVTPVVVAYGGFLIWLKGM